MLSHFNNIRGEVHAKVKAMVGIRTGYDVHLSFEMRHEVPVLTVKKLGSLGRRWQPK